MKNHGKPPHPKWWIKTKKYLYYNLIFLFFSTILGFLLGRYALLLCQWAFYGSAVLLHFTLRWTPYYPWASEQITLWGFVFLSYLCTILFFIA